jgi:4-carboxymuconolactone decarboxylase
MSGRLPSLTPNELNLEQHGLYQSLVENEVPWAERAEVEVMASDGSLLGPFNPLLFSPGLSAAQIEVFRADKRSSSLSPLVHEIVVLTVGAAWDAQYEVYAHSAIGKRAGLTDAVIEAIASGRTPDLASEPEAVAYEFARQLATQHRVDSETYARAERAFGDKGLVDLVLLAGLYFSTCAIINAFEIPVPEAVRQ